MRKRQKLNVLAIKGSSQAEKEIFSSPRQSVDMGKKSKASKFGVKPYMVGTQKAKDLILGQDSGAGRMKLEGAGAGRMHWYESVRPDWYEQMTSEVKVPHKTMRNTRIWVKKQGVRNEALDTCVYALHAARFLKINLWREERWAALENALRVVKIKDGQEKTHQNEQEKQTKTPAKAGFFMPKSGYSATKW